MPGGSHQGLADGFNKLLLSEKRLREEIESLERKIQQLNEELGRFEEAVSVANRVLEMSPDHVEAQAIVDRLQM